MSRATGLSAWAVPLEWLPVRLGPPVIRVPDTAEWRYTFAVAGRPSDVRCGYWLCENPEATSDPITAVHIRYCSLSYGHDDGCVWQNPMPEMPHG